MAKLHNVPICKVGGSRPLKLPLSRPPLARPLGFPNKTLCKMSMAERARASQCLPVPGYMPWHRPARARAICVQRASSQAAAPHIGFIVGAGSCWWLPRVVASRSASAKCFAPPAHPRATLVGYNIVRAKPIRPPRKGGTPLSARARRLPRQCGDCGVTVTGTQRTPPHSGITALTRRAGSSSSVASTGRSRSRSRVRWW